MPTVRVDDGTSLAYQIRGNGALGLLFMHGWAGSGADWDETLAHLNLTGVRAVCVDLRGHGESDGGQTGFTDERFARDMLASADAEGIQTLVPVGFSMSGRFAQYVGVLAPQRVAGQVLIAGCPASPIPLPPEVQRDWVARAGVAERLRGVPEMCMSRPVPRAVLDRWADVAARTPAFVLDETLNMCTLTSFAHDLTQSRIPTLVVGGIHDPIFTAEMLRTGVAAPFPSARVVLLDCGHEIPMEAPTELAGLIEAFVAGCARPDLLVRQAGAA